MIPTFDPALRLLLRHEGGFVNHPSDPGGMTCCGVTKAVWDAHTGKSATEADMRALTPQAVQPIYKARYWDTIHGDDLDGCHSEPALAGEESQRRKMIHRACMA